MLHFLLTTELKGAAGQIVSGEKMVLAVEQNKVLVPPTYMRYLAWGFADTSLRIGNYDSDKVCQDVFSFSCCIGIVFNYFLCKNKIQIDYLYSPYVICTGNSSF